MRREGKVLATCKFEATGDWKKYTAKLAATETAADASLTITYTGPGTVWLDNLSLMPEDSVSGWRRDVVEAIRELKPGVIRFGGMPWMSLGMAVSSGRTPSAIPISANRCGPGVACSPPAQDLKRSSSYASLLVRNHCFASASRDGRRDSAEQIEYFNGTANTPMGKLRVKNGHKEPYGIKYWQIGNERSGKDYEDGLAAYARAMKETDPNIKLLSSYPTPEVSAQWRRNGSNMFARTTTLSPTLPGRKTTSQTFAG